MAGVMDPSEQVPTLSKPVEHNPDAFPGDWDYNPPMDTEGDAPADKISEADRAAQRELELEAQQQRELNAELTGDMIVLLAELGTEGEDGRMVRTSQTLPYVKDIRRLLNFDFKTNVETREIFLKLGSWNLLQTKIVPLLLSYWDDKLLSFELLKVMVLMTDAPSDMAPPDLRERHLQILYRYKDEFLKHDVLAMLMQVVADPLSREGRDRTEDDCKFIELVLHLFKNLLVVPNAEKLRECSGGDNMTHMHDDLLAAFQRENVLEMLLLMTQDIREERYQHWGVLVLEMLACIFRNKSAESIIKASKSDQKDQKPPSEEAAVSEAAKKPDHSPAHPKFDPSDPLYTLLCQDKQKKINANKMASTRHNRFYGSFRPESKSKPYKGFRRGFKESAPGVAPPIGSKKPLLTPPDSQMAPEVARMLMDFVQDFLEYSYGQMLQVVVRKIVHMSPEIRWEDIMNFCAVNSVILGLQQIHAPLSPTRVGLVAHAIEPHNFKFILRYFEETQDPKLKQTHQLPPLLSCLKAMLQTVRQVDNASGLEAKAAARKLELNLLYDQQMLTMVVTQLREYNPTRHDRHFVEDLIEIGHFIVKMTEEFVKSQQTVLVRKRGRKKKQKAKDKAKKKKMEQEGEQEEEEEQQEQEQEEEEAIEEELFEQEKELDVSLVVQLFCHPKIISQYLLVLKHWHSNNPRLNHYAVRMLTQICKHQSGQLLPMLYQVSTLCVFKEIIDNIPTEMLATRSDLKEVHSFSLAITRNFLRSLKANPVLACDALFLKNRQTSMQIAYNYDVPVKDKNNPRADRDVETTMAQEAAWEEAEDQLLRDQYPAMASKSGVCNILARELGGERNAQMVSRRLAVLGLRKRGDAYRHASDRRPEFLKKTVGILRQGAHDTLRNTIQRASHPGLRAKTLVAALKWVQTSVNRAFEIREEQHMEGVRLNRRSEPPQDFCLVPVLEEHWKWLDLHWMAGVLHSLCIRAANPGEAYWRIPSQLDNAKLEMVMDVLSAFLEEQPAVQDQQDDIIPQDFEDKDDPAKLGEELAGGTDDVSSDEEWEELARKPVGRRSRGMGVEEAVELPEDFEEPATTGEEPAETESDQDTEPPAEKEHRPDPSPHPEDEGKNGAGGKKKKKRKKKDRATDKTAHKKRKAKLDVLISKQKAAAAAADGDGQDEEQPREQPQVAAAAPKRRKLVKKALVPEDGGEEDEREPADQGGQQDQETEGEAQEKPKRRKLGKKPQVDSDDEDTPGIDAEPTESATLEEDDNVVPDSYVPNRRRNVIMDDDSDE